ncbi:MAG TPA: hypothetical protein VGE01_03060 [Fimbriimonas sp.]
MRPQTIAPAPVVEQHHHTHERDVIIEKSGWSAEAVAMATIAGLILFGLLLYYMWYRPAYVETSNPAVIERNTVIEKESSPQPSTIITPPPVVNTPPPVADTPDVNITTPPVTIENHTTPPADQTAEMDARSDATDAPPVVDGE